MRLFKFKRYNYKPSLKAKKELKIVKLTNKYEHIFLKVINKENLSSNENQLLFNGIEEIKNYIFNSLFLSFNSTNQNKLQVKLVTLYSKLKQIDNDSFEEDLLEIITESIYEAIGLSDKQEKVFSKGKDSSYIIKYIQKLAFFKALNFLESKYEYLNRETYNLKYQNSYETENVFFEEEEIKHLLKKSNFKEALPFDIYKRIEDSLLYKETPEKDLVPYLDILLKLKEQNENFSN